MPFLQQWGNSCFCGGFVLRSVLASIVVDETGLLVKTRVHATNRSGEKRIERAKGTPNDGLYDIGLYDIEGIVTYLVSLQQRSKMVVGLGSAWINLKVDGVLPKLRGEVVSVQETGW